MAIYHEDIANIELSSGQIFRSFMNHTIGSGDTEANRFGVRVMRNGEDVDLTGVSCFGYFRNAEGTNIALTSEGTVSGSVAYVTLPQACYNVEGQFTLSIKLIGGGVTGTMRIVDGVVDNTNTGSAVAPTEDVPTYTEILAVYDQMLEAVEDYDETVTEQNTKIDNIKSAIKLYDAVEIAPFTDSGSYSIGAVGSVVGDPTLSASSTMLCYKFSCSPGDVFEFDIYGSGTSSGGARGYGWLNANNEVISRADRSVKVEGIQYAPEGAAYLVVNTIKTYGGYVIKGNKISAELIENDNNWKGVHNLIPENTKSRPFVWKSAGSDSYQTGWRTGYIDNEGTYQTSTSYIRTVLIPSAKIKGATACLIVPPAGYFAWVDVFVNDYVGSENFVAQYGNYFKQETGKEIYFNLSEGQSFVVSLGKFNSDAGDYLTETFTKTIGCELFFSNKSDYAGKKLSLLGDSISALAGDIPEGNRVYYTGSNMGILNSSQMWYSVLCNELGMIPLVINGWSGSCVTSGVRSDSTYKPASDASRCEALHDGTTNPDVVLIAMGVNDYSYMEDAAKFGTWDGSTALGEQSDLSDYINTDFKRAYATMIARIRRKYPEAQIVCITPWFVCRKTTDTGVTYLNAIGKKENDYGEAIREIASIMNVQVVDGTNIGLNRYNMYPTYAEDSSSIPTHPNATGHALMGHAIATQLVNIPAK